MQLIKYQLLNNVKKISMLKINIIVSIFSFIGLTSFFVPPIKSIYIEEYNYTFTPQKICIDTLSAKLDDGRELKIFLSECEGKMHIICFKRNKKVEEGDYISSLDLLKKYIFVSNGRSGKTSIKVKEYYQPLRSGVWQFYNQRGVEVTKKIYERGVLVRG